MICGRFYNDSLSWKYTNRNEVGTTLLFRSLQSPNTWRACDSGYSRWILTKSLAPLTWIHTPNTHIKSWVFLRNCLLFGRTWFHPWILWSLFCSIFSVLCSALHIVVCLLFSGHCVVCPSLIYGLFTPLVSSNSSWEYRFWTHTYNIVQSEHCIYSIWSSDFFFFSMSTLTHAQKFYDLN
jgi:hypothetical protein